MRNRPNTEKTRRARRIDPSLAHIDQLNAEIDASRDRELRTIDAMNAEMEQAQTRRRRSRDILSGRDSLRLVIDNGRR